MITAPVLVFGIDGADFDIVEELLAAGRMPTLARLRAAGASPADVGQGPEVTWVVLADPEGNEFCVLSPR